MAPDNERTALILSGGGARAAYQVGVLRAIAKLIPAKAPNPFPIICGTSAGGINAASLAAGSGNFRRAVCRLDYIWKNIRCEDVYRGDFLFISLRIFHWIFSLLLGGLGKHNPRSFLDNAPLESTLMRLIPFHRIDDAVQSGALRAVTITVSGYHSGQSVSFFTGSADIENWNRVQRLGVRSPINVKHLLATSAIPFVFPAVRINREFFGDGSVRQVAPISPALHLGAKKILVIGLSPLREEQIVREHNVSYPSLALVAGHLMNSVFIDGMETDLERLTRVNRTISYIDQAIVERGEVQLRPVQVLSICPSKPLEQLAARHSRHFPRGMRFLLGGLGALKRQGSVLTSYVLFNKYYARDLIDLGYQDAMARREDILRFLGYDCQPESSDGPERDET